MIKRTNTLNQTSTKSGMIFTAQNYVLLVIGVALIFIGFLIMYLENEIDGFIALYVSPVLIVGGFAEIVYAIMKKTSSENK